jgi:hypothetical protein
MIFFQMEEQTEVMFIEVNPWSPWEAGHWNRATAPSDCTENTVFKVKKGVWPMCS